MWKQVSSRWLLERVGRVTVNASKLILLNRALIHKCMVCSILKTIIGSWNASSGDLYAPDSSVSIHFIHLYIVFKNIYIGFRIALA